MAKRNWALPTIASVLAISAVASGCSSNTDSKEGANGSSSPQPAASSSAAPSPVKVSVASMPKYAPNQTPNDYTKEVEQRFNMKWDLQVIPLSAGTEKFNVMFASGDYPDFIPNMNSPSSVAKWASAGYLLPVSDYIDKLPNYRKLFSDEDWKIMLDFASTNGKMYMLPNVAANDPMTWIYRKDAFDKAGVASFPKTMDEMYEALKKLKAAYPDSVGIGVRGGTGNSGITNLINGFRQGFRNPNNSHTKGFWLDPDAGNQLTWNMASEKHREMLKFIAKLYKEGLVEKEFATLTQDQWKTKRLTGKVLLDFQWASHVIDPAYELKDIPGGQWDFARALPSASADKPALEIKPLNFSLFGPIFSNKLAKEPEKMDRIFEYIEWASTPEGQLFHQMGLQDVTYTKDASGKIAYKDGLNRQKVAEQNGFDWMIKQSEEVQKSDPLFIKKQEAMKEVAGIYNVTPRSAALTEEEQQTINTTVSALEDVAFQFATKAVMGIVDVNNDNVWKSYLSDLEKVGLNKALEIYSKYLK